MLKAACLLLCMLMAACTSKPPLLASYLPQAAAPIELEAVPFFPQERYQCGPAALATVLQASGVSVLPETLVPKVYIPELEGSLQAEMVAATRSYARVPYRLSGGIEALLAELQAGRPVLVLQNLGWDFYPVWHYAVVIGYLPNADRLLLRSGTERRKQLGAAAFLDNWAKADNWAMLALPPGQLPAADAPRDYLQAVAGLEEVGEVAAAASAYGAAVSRWPQLAAAWFGLGNARYALGDTGAAVRAYRSALQEQKNAPLVRNNLAQALAEQGCLDAADAQIRQAIVEAPPELRPQLEQTRDGIQALPPGPGCPL